MGNDEMLVFIKDMFEKKVEELKLNTGTLVEGLRSDVKAIAEGHSFLDRKIDNLQKDLIETRHDLKEVVLTILEIYKIPFLLTWGASWSYTPNNI